MHLMMILEVTVMVYACTSYCDVYVVHGVCVCVCVCVCNCVSMRKGGWVCLFVCGGGGVSCKGVCVCVCVCVCESCKGVCVGVCMWGCARAHA